MSFIGSYRVFDRFTLREYIYAIYAFDVRISLFRINDVIISRESVNEILNAGINYEEIIGIWAYDYALRRDEFHNIYPYNRIRSDGRLEVPRRINLRYGLADLVKKGFRFFPVTVIYKLKPESYELTVLLPYEAGMYEGKGKDEEYKITKFYPINFLYKDEEELFAQLFNMHGKEMIDLWYNVFCWFKGIAKEEDLVTGITNVVKDYLLSPSDYDKVRGIITNITRGVVRQDKVGFKNEILSHPVCGWNAMRFDIEYPECYYRIFLDIDDKVLYTHSFYTIEDYIFNYLIPKLNELNIKYDNILVFLSSKKFIHYNYHIIVNCRLSKEEWLKIDNILIEDERRKMFHKAQGISVLRISEKKGVPKPQLIKIIKP